MKKEIKTTKFNQIIMTGVGEVNIHTAEEYFVVVNTTPKLMEYINVEVEDNTLILSMKKNSFMNLKNIIFDVYTPKIEKVINTGVGNFNFIGDQNNSLSIIHNGVGNYHLNDGTTETLTIIQAGVGRIDASKLIADKVSVNLSGIGNISVHAKDDLSVNISGIGKVRNSGNIKPNNKNFNEITKNMWFMSFIYLFCFILFAKN